MILSSFQVTVKWFIKSLSYGLCKIDSNNAINSLKPFYIINFLYKNVF